MAEMGNCLVTTHGDGLWWVWFSISQKKKKTLHHMDGEFAVFSFEHFLSPNASSDMVTAYLPV
jgi:hypothetical protein